METSTIIGGCIVGFFAIISAIYVSFTAREKGPIISNSYAWLTKEQREKADKKAEYKLLTIICSGISATFAFLTIHIFTNWNWAFYLMLICAIFIIIYAIRDTVRTAKKK